MEFHHWIFFESGLQNLLCACTFSKLSGTGLQTPIHILDPGLYRKDCKEYFRQLAVFVPFASRYMKFAFQSLFLRIRQFVLYRGFEFGMFLYFSESE